MKPMKFKKISDENKMLGFNEIIILGKDLFLSFNRHPSENEIANFNGLANNVNVYEYKYDAICDGHFMSILEDEWYEQSENYEFVEFI